MCDQPRSLQKVRRFTHEARMTRNLVVATRDRISGRCRGARQMTHLRRPTIGFAAALTWANCSLVSPYSCMRRTNASAALAQTGVTVHGAEDGGGVAHPASITAVAIPIGIRRWSRRPMYR